MFITMEGQTEHDQLLAELAVALGFDVYIGLLAFDDCEAVEITATSGVSEEYLARFSAETTLAAICRLIRESEGPLVLAVDRTDASPAILEFLRSAGIGSMGLFQSDAVDGGTMIHCIGTTTATKAPFDATSRSVIEVVCTGLSRRAAEAERRTDQFRRLVLQLSESENRERRRVAELIHDDLQQILAGAKVHVDMARRRADGDSFLEERLSTAADLLSDVIERSRTLSHELQPTILSRQGLWAALSSLAGQMEKTHGLSVAIHSTSQVPQLSETVKTFVYRAVQELLFNVVKHAGVDQAELRVWAEDNWFFVEVRDHGKGFQVPTAHLTE